MTIKEFLSKCTQEYLDVELYNRDTEKDITIFIGDLKKKAYKELIKKEVISWYTDCEKIHIVY